MAKLIMEDEGEREVADNTSIRDDIEEMGIPIACSEGICQACRIEIIEGKENLSELSEAEVDGGMDENNRLGCQCTIKTGTVKFRY